MGVPGCIYAKGDAGGIEEGNCGYAVLITSAVKTGDWNHKTIATTLP